MSISSGQKRIEVAFSGSGGQGMMLAGKILAEAVSIFDGKQAVMTQSYGPEARGGASRAEIIISDGQIHYPKVMNLNVLLVMTQEAMDKYGKMLQPGGLLIADEQMVKTIPPQFNNVFKAPFTALAKDTLGAVIVTNILALGAVASVSRVVSREALTLAVVARVPEKVLALNRSALELGYKIADDSGFRWECPA